MKKKKEGSFLLIDIIDTYIITFSWKFWMIIHEKKKEKIVTIRIKD